MSRDRIITRKRNKFTIIAAAGALSVAAAASAAAVAWPSGSPAGPAAFGDLTIAGGPAAEGQASTQHRSLSASRAQGFGHEAIMTMLTEAAATKTAEKPAGAARQAAARRAARLAAKRSQVSQQARRTRHSAAAAPSSPGSPRAIAKTMLASFGWPSRQFSCLEPLWAGESRWSVTASNPSTGAYGIPQALPGRKMAGAGPHWQTDASTQIRWGLKYIRGTYGSPCAAWNHERAEGWY